MKLKKNNNKKKREKNVTFFVKLT